MNHDMKTCESQPDLLEASYPQALSKTGYPAGPLTSVCQRGSSTGRHSSICGRLGTAEGPRLYTPELPKHLDPVLTAPLYKAEKGKEKAGTLVIKKTSNTTPQEPSTGAEGQASVSVTSCRGRGAGYGGTEATVADRTHCPTGGVVDPILSVSTSRVTDQKADPEGPSPGRLRLPQDGLSF